MAICPNKNLKEWKILVKNHGSDQALEIWMKLNKDKKESEPEIFPEIPLAERDSFVENKGSTQEEVLNKLNETKKEILEEKELKWEVPKKGHSLSKVRKGSKLEVERYIRVVPETGERKIVTGRVTDVQDILFRNNRSRQEADEINNRPKNKILARRGTDLHAVSQDITESLKKKEKPVKPDWLTNRAFETLEYGVTKVARDIKAVQNTIDRDGNTTVLTEVSVYDPYKDKAGSIDVVAIFSDGSVAIYDYKFVNFYQANGKVIDYEDKLDMKEESWDMQIGEYKRILRDVYGVDLVRRSRVIPANVQYKYEQRGTGVEMTDTVHKLEMGNEEYTAPVPLADELSDDRKLNRLLEKLFVLSKNLKTATKGSRNRMAAIASKRRVQEAIKAIQLKKDFTFLVNEINAINTEIQTGVSINDMNDPLYLSAPQLKFYKDSLSVYKTLSETSKNAILNNKELTDKEKEELINAANNAAGVATLAIELLYDKQKERVSAEAEKKGIKNIFSLQKETSGGFLVTGNKGKYFSDWTHPIFRLAKKEIDTEVIDFTRHKVQEVEENLGRLTNNLMKWGKANGYKGLDVYNPLINPKTSNLVTEFTPELWEKRNEAIEQKDITWLKNNFHQSKENKEEYDKAKKNQVRWINQAHRNKSEDWRKKALKWWEIKNNPEHEEAWYNPYTRLTLTNPDKWRSSEYNFIVKNKPLKEYYDYYSTLMKELSAIFPDKNLKKNFVPWIHKNMVDTLAENGMNAGLFKGGAIGATIGTLALPGAGTLLGGAIGSFLGSKGNVESFLQSLEVREDDMTFGMTNTLTGEKEPSIPILYTNPLTDKTGAVNKNLKSKDLSKSLAVFANMAYNYQGVSKIEDIMLTLKEVLSKQDQILVNDYGKVIEFEGQIKRGKPKVDKTLESFDMYLKDYIYGVNIQSNDFVRKIGSKNYSGTKIVKETMRFFGLKTLGLSIASGFGAFVGATANMYMAAEKKFWFDRKQINAAKRAFLHGDGKAHAFFELLESTHEDVRARKADYLSVSRMSKTFSNHHAYILLTKADRNIDANVTVGMMMNYGLDPNYQGKPRIRRLKLIHKKNKKAKSLWEMGKMDKNKNAVMPKEITTELLDQFRREVMYAASTIKGQYSTEDKMLANLTLEGQAIMQFKNWMPRLISERFRTARYLEDFEAIELGRFRVIMGELLKKGTLPALKAFMGMFSEIASMGLFKHTLSGEASKRYFEEFLANNPDIQQQISRKELDYNEFFEQYKEQRVGQMRAFAMELRMYLMIVSAMAIAGGDWDDDGKALYKDIPGGEQALKLMKKASMELGFLFRPSEAKYLISNPIPVIKILFELENLIENSLDETRDWIMQDDYKGFIFMEKDSYDRSPPFKYTSKFIPVWKPAAEFFDFFEPSGEVKGKTKLEAVFGKEQ